MSLRDRPSVTDRLRLVAVAFATLVLLVSLLDTASLSAGAATHGTPTVVGIGANEVVGIGADEVVGIGADKWLHALGYALLGGVFASASTRPARAACVLGIGGAIAFGAGVELLQWYHPTRTASLADAVANGIGAAIGASAWYRFDRGERRR